MRFKTRCDLFNYIKFMVELNFFHELEAGFQGRSYHDVRNNKVYKIFHNFFDEDEYEEDFFIEYRKEDILKFNHIKNNTFIWASDVIIVGDEIIGYITDYVDAKNLYKIDPLEVDLEHFYNSVSSVYADLKIISDSGVLTYDVAYNVLYGQYGIFVIDHDEYSFSEIDTSILYGKNCANFNYEIMYFLVDGYFDEFINSYKDLSEMFDYKGKNINDFLVLFRKRLSECVGYEIVKLCEARSCLNKVKKSKTRYQRNLYTLR